MASAKKVALTGASGHLGNILLKQLVEAGFEVRILLRKPCSYIDHEDVVYGELDDESATSGLLEDCTVFIHCAAMVWPSMIQNPEVMRINYTVSKRLVEKARDLGVDHLVFISSIHSMQVPDESVVFNESAPLLDDARKPYDYSKAVMEDYLRNFKGMKVTVLNPTALIGPGDHYYRAMNQLFKRLYDGKLPAVTSGGFDVADIRDVGQAVVEVVKRQATGKYMLSGRYHTIAELAAMYAEQHGMKWKLRVLKPGAMRLIASITSPFERFRSKPFAMNRYAVESVLEGHRNISSKKARRELGYSNRPLDQTFEDLHHWFKEQEHA